MRKRKLSKIQTFASHNAGSAIMETVAGCFILLPVFLLLIDIIALVLAQSVNDDLAKQAARYAGQNTALALKTGTTTPDTGAMNSAATLTAQTYVDETSYHTTGQAIVSNAEAISATCTNTATGWQVQVITQITCYMPVPVPLGGPSFTTFQAQFTAPIVSIQDTPEQP